VRGQLPPRGRALNEGAAKGTQVQPVYVMLPFGDCCMALGCVGPKPLSTRLLPPADRERFLLCSDGLTSEVEDHQIEACLRTNLDPQKAAEELLRRALEAGGRDNITVIVVDGMSDADPSDTEQDTRPRGENVG